MNMSSACVSIWFVPLSGHVRSWGTLEVDSWDLGSDRRSAGLLFQSFILSRTFLPLGVHHPGTHKLFLSDYRWEVLFFPALLPCSPSSSNAAAWPRLMKPHQVSQAGLELLTLQLQHPFPSSGLGLSACTGISSLNPALSSSPHS